MTVIELMIVIAIIGGFAYIAASGFRMVTKADLVDDATRLSAVMRRTSQLAMESGQLHRVVLDLDQRRRSHVVDALAAVAHLVLDIRPVV